ncbi:uncharacterized protein IL334_004103 [Kwoniella shivajii]|uniref:Integral membrane protein n=1 Tax=Kwoniella shivajii TaxID=564305 RepID=A0ABZ1D3G3_9TREE|nr:hypothetical protein IL334_004103 [Kwoniella shivajii]
MHDNKTIENILATIGAVLWTIQGLPQIYKSYRTKSTQGISPHLMIIWALSAWFYMVYTVTRRLAIPMIVQVHVSLIVFLAAYCQCAYYSYGYSLKRILAIAAVCLIIAAACEAGSIYGLWAAKDLGTEIPMIAYGYMSSIMGVIGMLPQYYEIYIHREVTGLSYSFIVIDITGALFYIISLMFRPKLDISALVIYVLTSGMMIIIIVLALILNPRAVKKRRNAGSNQAVTHENSISDSTEGDPAHTDPAHTVYDNPEEEKPNAKCGVLWGDISSGPSIATDHQKDRNNIPVLEYGPDALEKV